jgi:hypothetical protein
MSMAYRTGAKRVLPASDVSCAKSNWLRVGAEPPGIEVVHSDETQSMARSRSLRAVRRGPARVDKAIQMVRGQRVVLGPDLARIYGVDTRALTQAVKRNADRFPEDFVFRLTRPEAMRVARSRSQSVILKRGSNIKHWPLAFTEHGAIMAASVLKSARAVHMSIFVVRAFLRLREWSASQAELSARITELEHRVGGHDDDVEAIIDALRRLAAPPPPPRKRIGFAPAGRLLSNPHPPASPRSRGRN